MWLLSRISGSLKSEAQNLKIKILEIGWLKKK